MPTDQNTVNNDKKWFMVLFNPGNWSIKWKTMFSFLLRAVVAIGLLLLLTNLIQRKMTYREINNTLYLLNDTKTKQIEEYFSHLNERIRTFSSSRQSIDAFNQLASSFQSIESDNYLLNSVSDLNQMNALLEGYYKTEILPSLEADNKITSAAKMKSILPEDNKQRILQYLYIAANPKAFGMKGSTARADDGSAYSYMHSLYHPEIVLFARQAGVSDVIFADYNSGYVIYSLRKNLDFATNLFEGPYRNSGLGIAFKSAISQHEQGSVSYTDATIYPASFNKPQIFISVPVFNGSQLIGAMIFALDNMILNNILSFEKNEALSLKTLKSVIVGDDLAYRCDDPEFIANPDSYIRKLHRNAESGETAVNAKKIGSTSLIQHVDKEAFEGLVKRKAGTIKYETETGSKVFGSYKPLNVGNLRWSLLTQVDRSEAMASVNRFMIMLTLIALTIAVILYFISTRLSNSIISRLNVIKNSITSLTSGDFSRILETNSNDEIGFIAGALNRLNLRMQATTGFVTELSKGNIDVDFTVEGDIDKFGQSLISVRESLIIRRADEEKRKKEDDIRNWTNHGIAMFNDIMRTENNDLDKLSLNIIRSLVQYLSANQGGLFLMEDEDDRPYLKLIATYAYDRQKFLKKRVEIGEGLAGTCVLEKKPILTNKLPDDYMIITSGLGGSKPKCLLVVPLQKDGEVLGVLEIASFEDFKPHEVEFVEKTAESIASALITVKLHLQTTRYLERFQQQAEEMKAQDEELRQNIEELQATHEQMERLKEEEKEKTQRQMKEMEDYRRLLINVLDHIPGKIFVKDHEGRLLLLNSEVAKVYNKTVEELLGTTDFDNHPHDLARQYRAKELEIIANGAETYIQEEDLTGSKKYLKTTKTPFNLPHLNTTGLLGIQLDVTDLVQIQEEIKLKGEELLKEKSLLDALLDNVPECIYFKDKESRFIRFSNSMLKLFGLSKKEELLGKSDFDFFSEEHARPAFEDEQNIINTGEAIIDLEEKEVMADGRISWANTTKMPLRDDKGNIIGTFGISKNISKIKNMEIEANEMSESLEKHRRLLIDILNRIPAKIFLKDENGAFVVVNEAVSSIYNKTPDQIIGTTDFDNHPDEDVESWRKQELEIIKTGEKTYLHTEKQNGKEKVLNTVKAPFMLPTTGKKGLLGIQTDITALKILEDEVRRLKEENNLLRKTSVNGKNHR